MSFSKKSLPSFFGLFYHIEIRNYFLIIAGIGTDAQSAGRVMNS